MTRRTELHALLSASPGGDVAPAGFSTDMCIRSTARRAFSLGRQPAAVAGAMVNPRAARSTRVRS